ncbi:hypothetical protein GXW77_13335 [Roseomonas alkaliterrae]|uniref:Uncharacterized protein n=1 Tax=Neoroseomonas alkaliterrae TaxID=1452450 RepID=A0A840XPA5_9PROT|nr:hypothetical protein [Neoroseomonas alkaliterrae]MBB5690428.1 hypothetical protein [Neoroseomonas alkaliterrae]MBR0677160.1 hypothetical protein [Neoroseomonas alkaliterrae]
MSDLTMWNEGAEVVAETEDAVAADRWTALLGIAALLVGFTAALAGAWLGFGMAEMPVALPGGLPALAPEALAQFMGLTGGVTMLLGAVSLYRAPGG